MSSTTQNKGAALLTALFVILLVAISTTLVMSITHARIRMMSLSKLFYQTTLTQENAILLGLSFLNVKHKHIYQSNHNGIIYTTVIKRNPKITLNIIDAQSRFNLNQLDDPLQFLLFSRFLKQHIPSLSTIKRNELLFSINLWLTGYQPGRGKDIFESYYLKQSPPYYSGHQAFKDISELIKVFQMNEERYQTIQKHVFILPKAVPFNIYTVQKTWLKALFPNEQKSVIDKIISLRKTPSKENQATISSLIQTANIGNNRIAFKSDYFFIETIIQNDILLEKHTVLVKRTETKEKKIKLTIL